MRHLLATFLMLLSFTTQAEEALMLYGGDGHKQFLGCLNCSKYDGNALCNKYGQSGSKYSSESIWNKYGNFGSKYSNFSPWNKYSASAPIIVDKNGNSYGYFSANKYHPNRTRYSPFLALLDLVVANDDLEAARDAYCGD